MNAPFNSIQEMISWAKSNPGKLDVGTSGLGSSDHLSQALLAKNAGIDVTFVHFKGDAPAWLALAQGTVQFRIATYISAKSFVDGGKIKLLGTATSQRTPVLPSLAAIAETVPGFAHVPYQAVVGPPGMPSDLVQKINRDFNAVGKMPEVNDRLGALGLTVINDRSPAQLAEYLQGAIRATIAAVEASGIKPE